MLRARRVFKQKLRSKAAPVLGAAAALSLANGAVAAMGGSAADVVSRNAGVSHQVTLCEEEISDVSLATFYVFDNEHAGIMRPRVRLAMGGCGCGGTCGIGCGEVSMSPDAGTSTFRTYTNPLGYSIRPARKYAHNPKRTSGPKNR